MVVPLESTITLSWLVIWWPSIWHFPIYWECEMVGWLVVWNINFIFPYNYWVAIIIPIDEVIFFRGGPGPPTISHCSRRQPGRISRLHALRPPLSGQQDVTRAEIDRRASGHGTEFPGSSYRYEVYMLLLQWCLLFIVYPTNHGKILTKKCGFTNKNSRCTHLKKLDFSRFTQLKSWISATSVRFHQQRPAFHDRFSHCGAWCLYDYDQPDWGDFGSSKKTLVSRFLWRFQWFLFRLEHRNGMRIMKNGWLVGGLVAINWAFSHIIIGLRIIPIDEVIFFRGVFAKKHQPVILPSHIIIVGITYITYIIITYIIIIPITYHSPCIFPWYNFELSDIFHRAELGLAIRTPWRTTGTATPSAGNVEVGFPSWEKPWVSTHGKSSIGGFVQREN